MIYLITLISLAGIISYYFKFKSDEKRKKREAKSKADTAPIEHDAYADIINDYPTYDRQNNVTNKSK